MVRFMTDVHSPEIRSFNMSKIKSKNTKPEEIVRKYLFSLGFRYRKNDNRLSGCPDIVLPKYRVIIFVNGCFWHMHDCPRFVMPKTRRDFWKQKLERSRRLDLENHAKLSDSGWRVIVIWECELSTIENRQKRLELLTEEIRKGNFA